MSILLTFMMVVTTFVTFIPVGTYALDTSSMFDDRTIKLTEQAVLTQGIKWLGSATRVQTAAVFSRYIKYLINNNKPDSSTEKTDAANNK